VRPDVGRHDAEVAALIDAELLDSAELPGRLDAQRLAGLVEDPSASLPLRLAAGGALAVIGDPRLTAVPELVRVVGGRLMLGTNPGDVDRITERWRHVGVHRSWIEKETPAHPVSVADFLIGRYPVTNAQYLAFLRASDHPARPSTWYLGAYPWDRSNHPVAGISADDADRYVAWLAASTGRGFRLPTEAEWERAARGPTDHEFPWGNDFDPGRANTRETGVYTTTAVGTFPAGRAPCGAFDMAGNVEEYVADRYAPYPGGRVIDDDLVETLARYRITRGGSFCRHGDLARTRRRHGPYRGPLYPCGLRVACDLAPGWRAAQGRL
jgi:toxoflavin biosynthesis protein ToxD